MPKVSVIIPVYKVEKYLKRCVESVRNQTLRDIEIILVDDGSPDYCPQICDEFAKMDNRIKVVHKKNGGVSAARNTGLDVAVGEYIAFVDSDDYIEENMYQRMVDVATTNNCDVVLADCLKEYPEKSVEYTHDIRGGYYSRKQLEEEYFPHLLIMENIEYPATISNCLCLFKQNRRKQFVKENVLGDSYVGLQDNNPLLRYKEGIRFSEDLIFGAQLLYNADSFYYMKGEYLYHYCMNSTSVTHNFNAEKWKDYLQLYQYAECYFGESNIYDFRKQLNLLLLFFVYNSMEDILKTSEITVYEKYRMGSIILNNSSVKKMFTCIEIGKLFITRKQKVLTVLYKYGIIYPLIIWREIR